jgi:hypothetical protein
VKGELAPLVLAARFTSFLGPGVHTTAPLDVSAFDRAAFEFWRGHLAGSEAGFKAFFEQADEPGPGPGPLDPEYPLSDPVNPWTILGSSFDTFNTSSLVELVLTKRYMRMRVGLTGDEAAITLFAVGSIRKRVPKVH